MSKTHASRKAREEAQALADSMVETLLAQQAVNPGSYMTLGDLARLTDAKANRVSVKKAARTKVFCKKAIVAKQGDLLAPVALKTDLSPLAKSHQILRYLLDLRAKNKTRAHTVASLKKQLTGRLKDRLKHRFQASVTRQLAEGKLPADVGCVVASNGKPHLFRLQDLMPEVWRTAIEKSQSLTTKPSTKLPSKPPIEAPDFAQEFESIFEQLDRDQGSYNFVTLAELRTSLPGYSREEFDARLRELRQARRFRLSGAENRSDVSARQRDAGIKEAGSLLLYAQRIKS